MKYLSSPLVSFSAFIVEPSGFSQPGGSTVLCPHCPFISNRQQLNCFRIKGGTIRLRNFKTVCYSGTGLRYLLKTRTMKDGLDILISGLQDLKGMAFWQRLVAITKRGEFKEIERGIYSAISPGDQDYNRLIDAARKAQSFGYVVYILPNPKRISSADFIFKNKKSYKLYELKTIQGKNSAGNRLRSSIGQSDRVLLNITVPYNPRRLADEINQHFESYQNAKEVLLFYRRRRISIQRDDANHILWRRLIKRK